MGQSVINVDSSTYRNSAPWKDTFVGFRRMKLRSISTEPFGIVGSSFNEASPIAVLTSRPVVRNFRKLR